MMKESKIEIEIEIDIERKSESIKKKKGKKSTNKEEVEPIISEGILFAILSEFVLQFEYWNIK